MSAKAITRKTRAAETAARWLAVYGENGNDWGIDKKKILKELRDLGPNPTPESVDNTIGNNSWTEVPECDGCGLENPDLVIQVGQEPDHDSATAHLCKSCMADALFCLAKAL